MAILHQDFLNNPKGKKVNSITENCKSTETRYIYVAEMAALSGYHKYYIYNLPREKFNWYKVGSERRIPIEAAIKFGNKFQNQLNRKNVMTERRNSISPFLRRA